MNFKLHLYLLFSFLFIGQILIAQDAGLNIANAEISELAKEKKYTSKDILQPIITDDYVSGGIRHIYYQQSIDNIGIYGTSGAVHLKDEKIITSDLQFIPEIEKRKIKKHFQVQAIEAVARLALYKGYPLSQTELVIVDSDNSKPHKPTILNAAGISNRTIPLKLVYMFNEKEELQLAWSVFIDEKEGAEYKNFIIDASKGQILLEKNLTISCTFDHDHDHSHDNALETIALEKEVEKSNLFDNHFNNFEGDSLYHVVPFNIESPLHSGSGGDSFRTIIMNPWENDIASPNGWHSMFGIDYLFTLGNNINAYSDRDNTNDPTGNNAARAGGGMDLVFDFEWNPTNTNAGQAPYIDAAVTNLFYMGNIAHDIFYNYGFDEASGNFQEENFEKGGRGSDNVIAEAQDASGTCNANFSTPGDGANPRMQMYLCNGRDGDFDNGVILHEYGHGVSIRLTGGPNATGCLGNVEQMGEGWSDFFGMLVTMKAGETKTTPRTIGTWLVNQQVGGAGLRKYPYTTDMAVNPVTYDSLDAPGITRPHGVGSVWATMLWDMNWALIDQYGWDSDIYNGTGGNNIALKLVIEGLKLQPCSPGFVDARDAILAADLALYGGVNRCIIWEAFAKRGLGYSADQGSSNSREDGVEAYDLAPECTIELKHTVDRNIAHLGERLTFELEAINHLNALANNIIITDTLPENVQFFSASDGGVLTGNVVQWPPFNLPVGGTKLMELKVTVNDTIDFEPNFLDDLESGGDNFEIFQRSGNNNWMVQDTYYYSPNNAWLIVNADTTSETHLILKDPLALSDSSTLSFNHFFDLEVGYDFGLVDISLDGGNTWINLENNFTQNGYNINTQFGHRAFGGASSSANANYITSIADLSAYAGEVAIIRFRLSTDISIAKFGWIVDDIAIRNTNYALPNFGNIRNGDYDFDTHVKTPTIINRGLVNHTVDTQSDTLYTEKGAGIAYANVQINDIDPDSPTDTLVTSIIGVPSNGTASVVLEDSIGYIPDVEFSGLDTVIYEVCDIAGACESDTLFIFVIASNYSPIANTDYVEIEVNTANIYIDVQANDSDPDGVGDTLITSILVTAKNGSTVVAHEDSIKYTPIADYFGLDTIIYQVCDTSNLCASDTVFITVLEEGAFICDSENLDMNGDPMVSGNYVVSNNLTSLGVISNDKIVKFVAGNSITLLSGFIAQSGADFTALISACVNNGLLIEEEEDSSNDRKSEIEVVGENTLLIRPNPLRNEAIIDYQLSQNSSIWIGLFDVTGKLMTIFVNQNTKMKGSYQYNLTADRLQNGVYWVTMKTDSTILTKKIFILKN